jgi:hypothetical protein
MMGRVFSCAIVCVGLLADPGAAFAFSDPMTFGLPPQQAGGGGRYFTGSKADGYTCRVCHSGGTATSLRVTGLPLDGYQIGRRYEVVVDWPDTIDKFAAAAEFTDEQGRPAGSVRLPPPDETQPAEYCAPASDQIPAASLQSVGLGRQIINVPDCGAKQLRFLWSAPTSDVGPVWFATSSVVSNGKGDTADDGVTDVAHVMGSISDATPSASEVATSCGVVTLGTAGSRSCWGLLVAACALASVRRARRASRAAALQGANGGR